jgi:hypothetical protein
MEGLRGDSRARGSKEKKEGMQHLHGEWVRDIIHGSHVSPRHARLLRLRQPGPLPRPPQRHTQCAWLAPHASRWATMAEVRVLSWLKIVGQSLKVRYEVILSENSPLIPHAVYSR